MSQLANPRRAARFQAIMFASNQTIGRSGVECLTDFAILVGGLISAAAGTAYEINCERDF